MEEVFNIMNHFALDRFPNATAKAHLIKLRNEVDEAINDDTDIYEYVDCLLCLFGAASKAGFTYQQLNEAAMTKMKINKKRKWTKLPDGTFQHE